MSTSSTSHAPGQDISSRMIFLLAAAAGLIVANLYYAQPLVGPISAALGISPGAAGLIVTLTQIGYGLGLLFLAPIGDLVENRRLILILLGVTTVALLCATFAQSAPQFFLASLAIGISSVAAQVVVPYAAHLSSPETRGQSVGKVMSGLLLGILLARPLASIVADMFGWHAIFGLSVLAMALLALVLMRFLPRRVPVGGLHYFDLLRSMWTLLKTTPVLRRRGAYHALLFATFSLFWTTVPLWLASPVYQMSQRGIGLFALAGVIGVFAAPMAGKLADRGHSRLATGIAMSAVAVGFLLMHVAQNGTPLGVALLLAAALLVDFGVSANLVIGQRAIYALGAEVRSRLNGLYMAMFFGGGAVGSALGGWIYAQAGWTGTAWLGFAFPCIGLLYFATEFRKRAD
ncbi:MFS transporter [Herbaspirillum sp. RTI4]|uniref:MFS transporter n=1 Tax=Herbaspirillum sp. RTI4 TaxID=3048640 RepID=UPI002AB5D420|nr:MFS transporter [Herbaspirillum sp. RTI4]MDY7577301.1 MFS transporter [Herbaspirillum sp. RTI4]MEA9982933.1 MFS transporter [Herbaspirillum sp. RTI4]